MKKQIRFAVISDIHLGNRRNETEFIVNNLNKYFCTDEIISRVDIVVLAGDVFDEMLTLSSDDVTPISIWISKLLILCKKYNVKLRVLEGTPSHDRRQSTQFVIINQILNYACNLNLDLKFITDLSIEYIDNFEINVLYVPDEWSHTSEETEHQVRKLLVSNNLTQVDFSIMHGFFGYQIPKIAKSFSAHSTDFYLNITKYLIWIGHVHTFSQYDRINAQGSFDRLAHNEEEIKGFLLSTINTDGTYQIEFVENKGARKFVTINCTNSSIENSLKMIDKKVCKLPNGSFVRIKTNVINPIFNSISVLKSRWPLLRWSIISEKEETEYSSIVIPEEYSYSPLIINKDNIKDLIINRLAKKDLDPDIYYKCSQHLEELKEM